MIARGTEPKVLVTTLFDEHGKRKPGLMKGKFKLGPEFFEPLPPEELDAWGQ